ncbi:MAG: hypothetical protein WBG86_07930 [Polyangiales bacterium]
MLSLCLLALGCGGTVDGQGGNGGSGAGGAPAPQCETDQDCLDLYDWVGGAACDTEGQCYECEHADPVPGDAEAPLVWDPEAFVPGDELGLDPSLAYFEIPEAEAELDLWGPIAEVYACGDVLEGGDVVQSDQCTTFGPDDVGWEGDTLYVPAGPVEWLMTEPLDGTYFRDFTIVDELDDEPFYLCERWSDLRSVRQA